MPSQRRANASQDLARRFLQLDADIRLAAAANGLIPLQKERPQSPAQSYPYDAELHHPKPKPAHGPIKIKQLEHVAKCKPSLKPRSVSDPGDAHRLISRFVHEKSRSMTVQTSLPAPTSDRAFPFPSMAIRQGPQLENFMELDSTADEIGHDDPLALKMGQILARRAAAATRALSSSRRSSLASGRRSVDSNGRRSIDSGRKSRLRIESFLNERDLLVPPSVVVDDRSPQEGPSRVWPRAPKSKGLVTKTDESLNTFTFPVMPQSQSQSHFGSVPPAHFGTPSYQLSIHTRIPLTVQTDLDPSVSPVMFQDDARSVSFVMQASPTSGVYVSPVESVGFSTSFEDVEVGFEDGPGMATTTSPTAARVPRVHNSPAARVPTAIRVQASPTAVRQSSPLAVRIQTSPTVARFQPSPRFQGSPSARFQHSQGSPTASRAPPASSSRIPVVRQMSIADTRHHSSPGTVYSQPSPATPVKSNIPVPVKSNGTPTRANASSDAHMNLLRGLSPLPSHGLPLPAPVRQTLKRSSLLSDTFTTSLTSIQDTSTHEPAPILPNHDSIRQWTPPPPTTPPPHTPIAFSTPNGPPVFPTTTPPRPTRALSPIPARLRRTTLDPGSASDEVVFRGSSSSASSTPQKRKRRRNRLPVRAHSDGFMVPSESLGRGRTAQSLMRRGQTGDGGEMSSDGRDVVLFVPKSMGPPSRAPSPNKSLSRPPSPLKAGSLQKAGSPSKLSTSPSKLSASPSKLYMSPSKLSISPSKLSTSPSKLPVRVGSPTKMPSRSGSPLKQSASSSRVFPPPLVRRASIPLPEASPTRQAPPPGLGLLGTELLTSQELPRRPSIELREPIIVPPRQTQSLAHMPWSPPRHVLSRMETASREGSFHTARDSPALATELEFPHAFPLVGTPVHMDEERESTTVHSAVTAEENPLVHVQSAVRGTVSRPVTMTITRRPSNELGPSALAPSPSFPGPSHTPNSSSNGGSSNLHMASIPMRRDQHYSPPGSLPESVTPPTDMSRPPTERSNSHLEEDTFYSVNASDGTVENWIAVMSGMDAHGLAITRDAFEEFQNSGDEGMVVADALSISSAHRPDSAVVLDDLPLQEDDNESGESGSAGQSLSDVGTTTPSPSRSGSRHSVWLPPSGASGGNLVIQTSGLEPPEDDGNVSAFSINSDTSESNRLTVDQLQTVASIVHQLNGRTPIPSASSSHLRSPPSLATTSAAYVTPPRFVNPPYRAAHSAPSRTLSPGAVSITFSEASPSLSTIPPPSLVVHSENRNWFADNLVLGEYRRSLHYLRDDDQRALEEGEDVILYGGDWEHVGRRSESRATTSSVVPIEIPSDFDPTHADLQSRNKFSQFLLSFAGALRHQPPRSQRMVESALRTLRRQPSQPSPRYPEDLYDEIGRDEAGLVVPGTPRIPSHPVSSSSSSSSDITSALPDEDEIVEDFVRSIMTPQPGTPRRAPPPILVQGSNVLPWPALPSPISPRIRFARSVSRQTTLSQVTSPTHSGYSSLIPPPPRPRPRSIEPHWLTIYVARRWPIPDTYVTRRTYSAPSALGPPMPYLWRPICHISPERLWEITNLEVQVPIPPQMPPPAHSPLEPPNARQHFTTPATTQNHATTYSVSTSYSISISSSVGMMLPPPPPMVPTVFRTSHGNLPIESLSQLPPLPPSIPTLVERQMSNPSFTPANHLSSRLSLGSSIGSNRPSDHPRPPSSRIVTPVAVSKRRGLKELVGRLVGGGGGGGGTRARTRSIHSRSSGPYVPKPKFGVAGKVVEVTRRIFRKGRRARLSSTRSHTQRTAAPET